MPVKYSKATNVVSAKFANRIRMTRMQLMLQRDNPMQDSVRFHFQALKVEVINDPDYRAPAIPQIDDPNFKQPDPANLVAIPQIDDPAYVTPKVPQIEILTVVDSRTLTKTIAEVAADHATEFAAVHAGIKKVAYAYMASENLFPVGTVE